MAEHRQPEGRLGDEDVAGHRLEGGAGRVRRALVVARRDDAQAAALHRDLRRPEHMPGRMERDAVTSPIRTGSPKAAASRAAASSSPEAERHDVERLARGKHRAVPAGRMIGMGVRHQRPRHRAHRVDVEIRRAGSRGPPAGGRADRRHACRRCRSRGRVVHPGLQCCTAASSIESTRSGQHNAVHDGQSGERTDHGR